MKRLWTILAVCAMIGSALSSCSHYKQNFHNSNSDYGSERAIREGTQSKTYGRINAPNANSLHNSKIFVSEQAMFDVMKIQGVDSAIVIVSENNAYVAVTTDNSATGTFGKDNTPGTDAAKEPRWSANVYGERPLRKPNLITGTNHRFTVRKGTFSAPAPKLQQNIARTVREMHPHVKQVFISSDPHFVNAMNSYARDYWLGKSIDGRIDEFNRMIEEIF